MAVTSYKHENDKQGGGKGEVTTTKTEGSFLNTEKEEEKRRRKTANKTKPDAIDAAILSTLVRF